MTDLRAPLLAAGFVLIGSADWALTAPERPELPPICDGEAAERPYDPDADARACYTEAIRAIRERVKAGAPVPAFLLSEKAAE